MTKKKAAKKSTDKGGRPPKEPVYSWASALKTADPEAWLTAAMQDESIDVKLRMDAAKALLARRGKNPVGKKEAAAIQAKVAHLGTEWDGVLQ